MTRNEIIGGIKEALGSDMVELLDKSEKRVYIEVTPGAVIRAARYLFNAVSARFNIASGMDLRDNFEILYHFTAEDADLVVSVRVKLPKENPSIESITGVVEGANWIEREMHEMLGINFTGHPNLKRLLLPENWPEDVFPLRADYKEWDGDSVRDRGIK